MKNSTDPQRESDADLPHDRDESPATPTDDAQHRHNRRPMEQARDDAESTIQDTERIGIASDVPTATPPSTRGEAQPVKR